MTRTQIGLLPGVNNVAVTQKLGGEAFVWATACVVVRQLPCWRPAR